MVNEYMLLKKNKNLEAIVNLSQSALVCNARTWWLCDCKEEGETIRCRNIKLENIMHDLVMNPLVN